MAEAEEIAFVLYAEPDDPYGEAYQSDMQRIWQDLQKRGLATAPPETKMPSPAAGGGWVTEYLIPGAAAAGAVITAITPIIQSWLKRGGDHHVSLKMGDLQVRAESKEEAEEELKKLMDLKKQQTSGSDSQ